MITINNVSKLMQKCVELGYTFMFSKSGIPNNYNIHIAYMPKVCDNRSLRLSLNSAEQIIYRCADECDGYYEFSDIPQAMQYITNSLTGERDDKP